MTSTTTGEPAGPGAPSPVPPPTGDTTRRRVASLDVLRGVAIIGTLATNIWIFTQGISHLDSSGEDPVARPDPETRAALPAEARMNAGDESGVSREGAAPADGLWSSPDFIIQTVSQVLVNGKFLALLSVLFGVGMVILFEAAQRRGHRWPFRYWWRSALLAFVGFLNYLFIFEFDILATYAMTAIVVAPLLFLRGWRLALAGGVLAAIHLATSIRDVMRLSDGARGEGQFEDGWRDWQLPGEALLFFPPGTAALMVIGVGLWRCGIFTRPVETRRLQWTLAVLGLVVGLGLTILSVLPGVPSDLSSSINELSRYALAPIVALGYLGAGLLLMRRFPDAWLSRRLSAVGRIALSGYLLQNIVAAVVFFHLGFGPLDSVGTIIAWAGISAFLVVFAEIWLRRFRTGPFEIAWRWLADAPFTTRRQVTS